jgi:3-oxoacyl-[acyl-carrier-protein] synthase-3
VANGGCGVLTALEIVDRFLRAGTVHTALVVASDADPGHGLAPPSPSTPLGAPWSVAGTTATVGWPGSAGTMTPPGLTAGAAVYRT